MQLGTNVSKRQKNKWTKSSDLEGAYPPHFPPGKSLVLLFACDRASNAWGHLSPIRCLVLGNTHKICHSNERAIHFSQKAGPLPTAREHRISRRV